MTSLHPGSPSGGPGAHSVRWRAANVAVSVVAVSASIATAPRASLVFLLPAVLCIGLEGLMPLQQGKRSGSAWLTDLTHAIGNRVMIAGGVSLLVWGAQFHGRVVPEWALAPVDRLPAPAAFVVVFLVADAVNYGFHRLSHEWSPLWRLHRVHHSSSRLDWLATSRGHVLDQVLAFAAVAVPGIVLGRPEYATVAAVVLYYWPFVCHANIAWSGGRLDWVLITPRAHHWHHGFEAAAVNRNYGAVLSVWDRIFGTWIAEDRYPVGYGTSDLPDRPDYLEHLLSPVHRRS